ncbi:hypothetical protein J5754_04465 [bacterium]|nr:hypothetical protein [bacterium]
MYDYDSFDYAGYTASFYLPNVPAISVAINAATAAEIETAINAYLNGSGEGAAADYVAAVRALAGNRDYIRGRFERDLCAAVGLAEINPAENTYTANKKANEFFAEAARGATLYTAAGLAAVGANLKRLYDNLLIEEGEPIYAETEAAEVYDDRALEITVGGNVANFYSIAPAATGNARQWAAYAADGTATHAIAYNAANARWQITAAGSDTPLLVKEDIDDALEEWAAPAE